MFTAAMCLGMIGFVAVCGIVFSRTMDEMLSSSQE
jgi:hypothetical protein